VTDADIAMAARNNAEWCEAVCRARGVPGRFTEHLWVNEQRTPPYYPSIITLHRSTDALRRELAEALDALRHSSGQQPSVKDSFADIDLAPFGCRILFAAEWIGRPAGLAAAPDPAGVVWSIVRDEPALAAWKIAWDEKILKEDPVFAPKLLGDPRVAFMTAHREGEVVAGAVAFRSEEAVGMSNVFVRADDLDAMWGGAVASVRDWASGLAIVGYESAADLERAMALGFRKLGKLRVWSA
jgi:hypothetical protein